MLHADMLNVVKIRAASLKGKESKKLWKGDKVIKQNSVGSFNVETHVSVWAGHEALLYCKILLHSILKIIIAPNHQGKKLYSAYSKIVSCIIHFGNVAI